MNSLTNIGGAMRQELVVLKTFLHLLPTHIDDPAFRKRFLELANQSVGELDNIATGLLTTRLPLSAKQSKADQPRS